GPGPRRGGGGGGGAEWGAGGGGGGGGGRGWGGGRGGGRSGGWGGAGWGGGGGAASGCGGVWWWGRGGGGARRRGRAGWWAAGGQGGPDGVGGEGLKARALVHDPDPLRERLGSQPAKDPKSPTCATSTIVTTPAAIASGHTRRAAHAWNARPCAATTTSPP